MISVYWTDVDTRPEGSGIVWYRETSDPELLSRFENEIKQAFTNLRLFRPISLFIATWERVGYYEEKFDKVVCMRS